MAKRKWSKELVVEAILRHEKRGTDLTSANMKKVDSPLVGAAVARFGNWGNAIKAAGLDYAKIKTRAPNPKWTEEKILEAIRELSGKESDISYTYMKKKHSSLVSAACNYFGSWKNAVKKCEVDYKEVVKKGASKRVENRQWRNNLLLERLDGMGVVDEKQIRDKESKFYDKLIEYFGTWRNVITALRKWQADKSKGKD